MNEAGFSAVGITAESGSDRILSSLGKGFDASILYEASRQLRNFKGMRMWTFLLGGPGEDAKSVRETAAFIESLPHTDLIFISYGIRILPGTMLQRQLAEQGQAVQDKDAIHPLFYHSPHITPAEAGKIIERCRFPSANIVSLTDGCHRLLPGIQALSAGLGLQPPFWRYVPLINRFRRVIGL